MRAPGPLPTAGTDQYLTVSLAPGAMKLVNRHGGKIAAGRQSSRLGFRLSRRPARLWRLQAGPASVGIAGCAGRIRLIPTPACDRTIRCRQLSLAPSEGGALPTSSVTVASQSQMDCIVQRRVGPPGQREAVLPCEARPMNQPTLREFPELPARALPPPEPLNRPEGHPLPLGVDRVPYFFG
jgi:hypothetical protein